MQYYSFRVLVDNKSQGWSKFGYERCVPNRIHHPS